MNRLVKVLLITILTAASLSAQVATGAVLPFQAISGISESDAAQFSEVFQNALIDIETVRLIEQSQTAELEQEQAFQSSGMTAERAMEIGRRLDADFLVLSSAAALRGELLFFVRIISVHSGRYLYGTSFSAETETVFARLEDAAGELIFWANQRLYGDPIERARVLLELGKLYEAEEILSMTATPDDERLEELLASVQEQGGAIACKEFRTAFAENELETARFWLHELIARDPENDNIPQFLGQLNTLEIRERNEEWKELQRRFKEEIKARQPIAAEKTLERLEGLDQSGEEAKEIAGLRGDLLHCKADLLIEGAKAELTLLSTTEAAYVDRLQRTYAVEGKAREALNLVPASSEARTLLTRVDAYRMKITANEERRLRKEVFAESGNRSRLYTGIRSDLTNFSDPYRETGGINGVFMAPGISFTYLLPLRGNLIITAAGDLAASWGTVDDAYRGADYTVDFTQVSLTAEPGILWPINRYDIGAGIGFRTGWRGYKAVRDDGTPRTFDGGNLLIALGPYLSGGINISQRWRLDARFSLYPSWYLGTYMFTQWRFGIGAMWGVVE